MIKLNRKHIDMLKRSPEDWSETDVDSFLYMMNITMAPHAEMVTVEHLGAMLEKGVLTKKFAKNIVEKYYKQEKQIEKEFNLKPPTEEKKYGPNGRPQTQNQSIFI